MNIQTFIFLENEQCHLSIEEHERIQSYVNKKEDWLEDGFLNLEGIIAFSHDRNGLIQGMDASDEFAPLWQYYTEALDCYLKKDYATFYYPNTPIEVTFKKHSSHSLSLRIDQDEVVYKTAEFIRAFQQAAASFLELINSLSKGAYSDDLLVKVKALAK